MKLLVVNPNTSASMTARIGAAARAAAAAGTEIVAVNPESGPASIEGYLRSVRCAHRHWRCERAAGRWSRARAGTGA